MHHVLAITLITSDPAVRGGRPCLAGTSLRVTDVAMAHLFHQRTVDEIATDYGLSLAQVHAALSYYYQNKAELDPDIRRQVRTARRLKERHDDDADPILS